MSLPVGEVTSLRPEGRIVSAHIEATIESRSTQALAIAVADGYSCDEQFDASVDGRPLPVEVVVTAHDGRVHLLRDAPPGRLVVDYQARVTGAAPAASVDDSQWLRYLRPSRYCESDRIGPFARSEFAGLSTEGLIAAVPSWVAARTRYVPGASRPTDGAVATLMAGEGVCRDFAHLTAALLRANDVAARVVSVYAPGLSPMDFHAVTEALVAGRWVVVDSTGLAPRQSLVRIATGADAADTAFLSTIGGRLDLTGMEVTAVADPDLPIDDLSMAEELR
ncbi:MAG: transglutaminase family protein [Acidimicrobiales bacterium]